jgi:hypothetical protein
MSAVLAPPGSAAAHDLPIDAFGKLVPVSRAGGQGRVHRPAVVPPELGAGPVVVKLYHRPPPVGGSGVLAAMAAWGALAERTTLHRLAAWPLATVSAGDDVAGIVMRDVSARFSVPFLMPSGRAQPVLLALEHLLGGDWYLERRGLAVTLNTDVRTWVAARISGSLAALHRQAIVVADLAPSNLLVSFRRGLDVCFIDCDSMVFRGRRALNAVETGDWTVPAGEASDTRAADAYKLGLVILRLFSRTHDARDAEPHLRHVPGPVRPLLLRALGPEPANRPAAGEWQRALTPLAAAGGLSERYPGPARRPPSPPVRRPAPRHPAPRHPAPTQAAPFRASAGRRSAAPTLWLALLFVLILLTIRLLAALPDQQGWSASGPAPQQPLHYYVIPGQP